MNIVRSLLHAEAVVTAASHPTRASASLGSDALTADRVPMTPGQTAAAVEH